MTNFYLETLTLKRNKLFGDIITNHFKMGEQTKESRSIDNEGNMFNGYFRLSNKHILI